MLPERGFEPAKIPPIEASREKAVTFIEVSKALKRDLILETGSMDVAAGSAPRMLLGHD